MLKVRKIMSWLIIAMKIKWKLERPNKIKN